MRATRWIFLILGWPMIVSGLVMIAFAALERDELGALLGLGIGGVSLALTGLVFVIVARALKRLLGADALDDPVPGIATVRSVTDTGVTINEINAVFEIEATIEVDGTAPYVGRFRIVVGRAQFGLVQPGATVPVLVERADPTRIVHDPDRPVLVGGSGGSPTAARTLSAADLIERGVPTSGTLVAAEPLGVAAGQVVDSLPAHEADDALVRVVFTYEPAGEPERRSEVVVRVPDGKGHWLRPGETLPIVYLDADRSIATIDWSRL